jgi:hypothetical protein
MTDWDTIIYEQIDRISFSKLFILLVYRTEERKEEPEQLISPAAGRSHVIAGTMSHTELRET